MILAPEIFRDHLLSKQAIIDAFGQRIYFDKTPQDLADWPALALVFRGSKQWDSAEIFDAKFDIAVWSTSQLLAHIALGALWDVVGTWHKETETNSGAIINGVSQETDFQDLGESKTHLGRFRSFVSLGIRILQ